MRPVIELIVVDSGGGHRAAAQALLASIHSRDLNWDVRVSCIQDLLAPIDFIHRYTGVPFQDLYGILLRKGWTAFSGPLLPVMHALIRASHAAQVRVLASHWTQSRPDLVVSLIPHFNRALKQSLDRALPGTPYVTVLTDIADCPPHFWLERQEQYVICGSDRAEQQANQIGIPPDRTLRASGMIVHPRFYEPLRLHRGFERSLLGLDPDRPTALILFGGEGSPEVADVARRLNHPRSVVQLIVICGRHDAMRREVEALPRFVPIFVEGFTDRVPYYMELADLFIGKPGPGSISEALVKRLPVIVRRDRATLVQERFNCEWILRQGVGAVMRRPEELCGVVAEVLRPERMLRFHQSMTRIPNRAVFEIPSMLEQILAAAPAQASSRPASAKPTARRIPLFAAKPSAPAAPRNSQHA